MVLAMALGVRGVIVLIGEKCRLPIVAPLGDMRGYVGQIVKLMEVVGHMERSSEQESKPTRIPVRTLALVTGFTGIAAQILSRISGDDGSAEVGPASVVLGQTVWNAAQVGLLLLLLCLWCTHRRWWTVALAIATLASLPFSIYALSPGGVVLTALLLTTCGLAWIRRVPDIEVAITDMTARDAPKIATLAFLAFTCNLLCSMYNFNASRFTVPYWSDIFARIAAYSGFTPDLTEIAQGMYTLGLDGVSLPSYINPGSRANNLGAVVFLVIWTVLPFLYVLYFALLAKLAKDSPGRRIQHALCFLSIFHFLFLTDFVDYRFGRGIANPVEGWCHWIERFVWRIAILLPIYQKLTTKHWLRGNGTLGVLLHYAVAAWAIGFLIYQVMLYDIPRFYLFAIGVDAPAHDIFGIGYYEELGYHGALVLMVLLYGLMVVAMRRKRIHVTSMVRLGAPADQTAHHPPPHATEVVSAPASHARGRRLLGIDVEIG